MKKLFVLRFPAASPTHLVTVLLRALAAFFLFACAPGTLVSPASQESLSMFRGNPAHTGIYDSAPLKQLSGVKGRSRPAGKYARVYALK